jgi:Pentaxin family
MGVFNTSDLVIGPINVNGKDLVPGDNILKNLTFEDRLEIVERETKRPRGGTGTDTGVTTDLTAYAKTTDLLPYAKATDLGPYAKTTDLATYATYTELHRVRAPVLVLNTVVGIDMVRPNGFVAPQTHQITFQTPTGAAGLVNLVYVIERYFTPASGGPMTYSVYTCTPSASPTGGIHDIAKMSSTSPNYSTMCQGIGAFVYTVRPFANLYYERSLPCVFDNAPAATVAPLLAPPELKYSLIGESFSAGTHQVFITADANRSTLQLTVHRTFTARTDTQSTVGIYTLVAGSTGIGSMGSGVGQFIYKIAYLLGGVPQQYATISFSNEPVSLPPVAIPTNVKWGGFNQNSVTVRWDAVPNATSYTINTNALSASVTDAVSPYTIQLPVSWQSSFPVTVSVQGVNAAGGGPPGVVIIPVNPMPPRYSSLLASTLTLANGAAVTTWNDASGTKPLLAAGGSRVPPTFVTAITGRPASVRWTKNAANQPILIDGYGTNGSGRIVPQLSSYTKMMLVYLVDAQSSANQAVWWGPFGTNTGHIIFSGPQWGQLTVGVGAWINQNNSQYNMAIYNQYYCIFQTYNKWNGRVTWTINGIPVGDPVNVTPLPIGGINRVVGDSQSEIGGIMSTQSGYGPSIDVVELAVWDTVLTPAQIGSETNRLVSLYGLNAGNYPVVS